MALKIKNLSIANGQTTIVSDCSLLVNPGELVVIMGQNGSGKSTLLNTIMGDPRYTITAGQIFLNENEMTDEPVDVRARAGLFLSMQNSPEIVGVSLTHFLRTAKEAITGEKQNPALFYRTLILELAKVGLDSTFASRAVNVGCSGGEKKRLDLVMMAILQPKIILLDEIDSGVDVDAVRFIESAIKEFLTRPDHSVVFVTHQTKIVRALQVSKVYIMKEGKIVKSGNMELINEVEQRGFENI